MHNAEGLVINTKRPYRICTEEDLKVQIKKRKMFQGTRQQLDVPLTANQGWPMDFASDQLSNGRHFSVLNVVDDLSREMVGL
jgi:putative transposase